MAAATDLSSRRIPNWLTLPLFAAGLAQGTLGGGLEGLLESFGSACLLALPFLVLFVFAGGGAGDAKLMGAVGSWLGFRGGLLALGAVCAAGIVCAFGFAIARRHLPTLLSNLRGLAKGLSFVVITRGRFRNAEALIPSPEKMQPFPYGVAIFLGVSTAAIGVFL